MILRKPALDDRGMLLNYIMEHYEYNEMHVSACNGLNTMPYLEWLEKLKRDEAGEDPVWGLNETYILVDNNKVIGMLNIRYDIKEAEALKYGHIGYGVRPTERRKGYATCMLKEALIKCREKGLNEVIIGCYEDNIGSNKTIMNNNGMLYRRARMKDKEANYYKIIL